MKSIIKKTAIIMLVLVAVQTAKASVSAQLFEATSTNAYLAGMCQTMMNQIDAVRLIKANKPEVDTIIITNYWADFIEQAGWNINNSIETCKVAIAQHKDHMEIVERYLEGAD
jgi:hypothetical protein